jgi:hypothetical protein
VLEPETEGAEEVVMGVIQVVSDPAGATVRINNEVRGETPLTIDKLDRSTPIQLEVSKEGYETSRRTEVFAAEETQRLVTVELTAVKKAAAEGVLSVVTDPAGASVMLGGERLGVTPLTVTVERRRRADVTLSLNGYKSVSRKIEWGRDSKVSVSVKLVAEKVLERTATAKRVTPPRRGSSKRRCGGTGAKLSVMPVGVADCRVKVGSTDLGIAPIFKKMAPIGTCEIKIVCPDGKTKTEVRKLTSGGETRVIIKPGQW